jgi:hypothetical protein
MKEEAKTLISKGCKKNVHDRLTTPVHCSICDIFSLYRQRHMIKHIIGVHMFDNKEAALLIKTNKSSCLDNRAGAKKVKAPGQYLRYHNLANFNISDT